MDADISSHWAWPLSVTHSRVELPVLIGTTGAQLVEVLHCHQTTAYTSDCTTCGLARMSGDNHVHADQDANHSLEEAHYMEVRYAFVEYSAYMEQAVRRIQSHYDRLPPSSRNMLSSAMTDRKIQGLRDAIARNQAFLNAVVNFQDKCSPFPVEDDVGRIPKPTRTSARQVGKVSTTLHQLVRDWSAEGEEERLQSYGAVMEELERLCPLNAEEDIAKKVLVPGAGLGRLAMEIVARGYSCEGNEFSYFMLMASNFMLNGSREAGKFRVSPFIDNQCNVFRVDDMLRTLKVPDVCPSSLLHKAGDSLDFSMTAGEWLGSYADQANEFDAIVTVFFLDTAPVVIDYIEAIARLLKDGGVWVNFGPLLYHWAQNSTGESDERFERSVELSWEEIRHVCAKCSLEIVRQERRDSTYNANRCSLMRTVYNGVFCSAIKRCQSTRKR